MNRRFALVLLLATLCADAAWAVQSPDQGLVIDRGRGAERRGAETLHPLRVDRRHFEAAAGGARVALPGSGARTIPARATRSERRGGDFTWVGTVETALGPQSAVITFGEDAVFGTIPQDRGPPLRVETRRGRTWLVEGENIKLMRTGGRNDARIPPAGGSDADSGSAPPAAASTATSVFSGPVVDVLVAYTPSLPSSYGSNSAALTRLTYLESLTNQAYADSGANVRIRVVARNLLDYTAASSNDTLLDLLTNASTHPVKTQVDGWRAQVGADLVIVVRAFDNVAHENCGLAWIGGYHGSGFDPRYAFATASDGSDGGYYCTDQTFAHELGHSMGLHHDTGTANGDYGAYTYSRGHRQTIDASTGFATVMAYSDGPQVTLNLFSNPSLYSCQSRPCGVAGVSEAARSLTNTASRVAAMRSATVTNVPSLAVADVTVTEGDSGTRTASFVLTPSFAPTTNIVFDAATASGSATAGSDFAALAPTQFAIAAGATSKTVAVTVNGDTTVEPDETFSLVLSNVTGATVADGTAVATIANDDAAPTPVAPPTISIADVAATEGNSGTKLLTFRVRLSKTTTAPVTYSIGTLDGGAKAGTDYVARTLTGQSIPAGALVRTFAVTINGDTLVEGNEGFVVRLSQVAGASVGDGYAVGMITNDDTAASGPKLSIANAAIMEGDSGTKTLTFTVSMSATSTSNVSFNIGTASGTAVAGSDYVAKSATAQVIPAGSLAKTFAVTINGDTATEANEAFYVVIGSASGGGATIADDRAVGTIVNDD